MMAGPSILCVSKVPISRKNDDILLRAQFEDIASVRAFGIKYWGSSSFWRERKAIVMTDT